MARGPRTRLPGWPLLILFAALALSAGVGHGAAPAAAPAPTAAADEGFPRSALEIRSASGRQWFNIRIADTEARQELGLMYVTRLPADEGMLFPHRTAQIMSMWMKNTLIPLDMLFIDAHGRIVCLLENTKPESLAILSCDKPVMAVLEIGGSEARKRGIRVGDRVVHRLFRK
jgi:uncharacterized membrane protein (UPF0127 family)